MALSYEHKISGLLKTLVKTDCKVDIQNAILTENGRNLIIWEFREKLQNIHLDVEAKEKVKSVIGLIFDKFKVWVLTYKNKS